MDILGPSGPYLGPLEPSDCHSWPVKWLHYIALSVPLLAPPLFVVPHCSTSSVPLDPLMAPRWPFWTLLNHSLEEKPQNPKKVVHPTWNIGKFIYICRLNILQEAQNIVFRIFPHEIPFLSVTGWKLGEKPQNAQNWKPHPNIWEFRSWLTPEWLTTFKQKNWPVFLWNLFSPSDWKKRPQNCYTALGPIFSLFSHEKLSNIWERQW